MSTEIEDVVTLGAQVGGRDADDVTKEHLLAFGKLLRKECRDIYSPDIEKFPLILRIDGSIQSWGKSGIDYVRFQRKQRYVTADIFVPRTAWEGIEPKAFRRYLAAQVVDAINRIAEHLKARKVELAIDKLHRDVDVAITKFLAE